ncbi:MAG: pyridoxal phosphate-dependent aminotransferase [Candidatus Hydrothermarchaeales archaeon]
MFVRWDYPTGGIEIAKFSGRVKYIDISGIRKMFELAKAGGIINLGIGEPDFSIPPQSKAAIKEALDEDFTHYTPSKGIMELREALVKKLKSENGIISNVEEIIVTSGASEALALGILTIVDPGEEVIIPDPGFVSYPPLIRTANGVPVPVQVKEENEFDFDVNDIEERITTNTKAIIINSPSNPTGAVSSKDVIKGIAQICDEKGIFVISDEVYEKIIYEGKHHSIAKFTDMAITINSFSKSYAMTGLRLGYVHSKLEIIEEMLKIHQYLQASTSSLSQRAALAALREGEKFINEMVGTFRERRDIMVELLNEIRDVDCLKPRGAFYAFPNFSKRGNSRELVMEFLKKAKVVATPGTAFGDHGEGYVRFSYATSRSNIEEGIRRIREAIH